MAGYGTGYRLTFKCAKCRSFEYEATGEVRRLTKSQRGTGHPRALRYRIGYVCRSCGHSGWSRHIDVEMKARHQQMILDQSIVYGQGR